MFIPHTAWLLLLTPVLLMGCSGTRPVGLGARDGKLLPCPSSPNCVSSQAPDEGHRVAPLAYSGSLDDAMNRLKEIVRSFRLPCSVRLSIATSNPRSLSRPTIFS